MKKEADKANKQKKLKQIKKRKKKLEITEEAKMQDKKLRSWIHEAEKEANILEKQKKELEIRKVRSQEADEEA